MGGGVYNPENTPWGRHWYIMHIGTDTNKLSCNSFFFFFN